MTYLLLVVAVVVAWLLIVKAIDWLAERQDLAEHRDLERLCEVSIRRWRDQAQVSRNAARSFRGSGDLPGMDRWAHDANTYDSCADELAHNLTRAAGARP